MLTGCMERQSEMVRLVAARWLRLQVFTGLLYIQVVVVNKRCRALWITGILSFQSAHWEKHKGTVNMFVHGG